MNTTLVSTATLRNNLADVLDEVVKKKIPMIITRKGKEIAAMVDLDLLEDLEALSSKNYLASIRRAREDYKKGRVFTHEEVFGQL